MPRVRVLQIGAVAVCGALIGQPALSAPLASTERVSVSSDGIEANDDSNRSAVSADGRFVAFGTDASNLVPGDTNGASDVFVRDRLTGVTERVSIASDKGETDGLSDGPSISADGRIVAFESRATNLVEGDTNGETDVFVYDRHTGVTERVSVDSHGAEGTDDSTGPRISADGRFVAFESDAPNLVAGDTNGRTDTFVHDRLTGATARVSVASDGSEADNGGDEPSISADDRFVAFQSAADNLAAEDENGFTDVFVHDRHTGETRLVSIVDNGSQANNASFKASISADGRYVAFGSLATNLVADDTNGEIDIFVRDRLAGVTERVSVGPGGSQADDNSFSDAASISADGRFVAFESAATNLVADDTNGEDDIFVHDRLMRTTELASVDSSGKQADDDSDDASISANGRFVLFLSGATNLVPGDTNATFDIFLRDRGLQPDGHDDLVIDFGGAGLWQYLDNATFQKIHNASPIGIASGDLDGSLQDEVIVSFAGHGLWARFDNATFKKLHNASPSLFRTGDLDGNGQDELIVDFGGAGLWVLYNNKTWVKLHGVSPQDLAVGDLDGNGKDELIVDFGGPGLWVLLNNVAFQKVHNASPVHMATADLDGNRRDELIVDFGSAGLWAYYNNASWQKRHSDTSQGFAAGDLDGNGQEDLMVDFGAAGLWVLVNNTRFVKLHAAPTRGFAAAGVN